MDSTVVIIGIVTAIGSLILVGPAALRHIRANPAFANNLGWLKAVVAWLAALVGIAWLYTLTQG